MTPPRRLIGSAAIRHGGVAAAVGEGRREGGAYLSPIARRPSGFPFQLPYSS